MALYRAGSTGEWHSQAGCAGYSKTTRKGMSDILLQSISIPVWITKAEKARPSFFFYLGYESVRKHIKTIYRWNKRVQAGWANGLREVFSGSANSRGIAKGERRRRRKKESYFCRSLWRPARRRVILKTFRIKHRQFWTVRKTCGTIYVDSNVVASCTVSSRSLINYPAPLNNFSVGCDASDVGKQTASNWETSVVGWPNCWVSTILLKKNR